MQLQLLIDRMIDQAHEVDPGGTYSILIGNAPATELEWVRGKKVYRWSTETSPARANRLRVERMPGAGRIGTRG